MIYNTVKNIFLRALLFIFLLISFYSCTKDPEIQLQGQFVIDSIRYVNYGADIYYKISVTGGTPPYNFSWITPSVNIGAGPFHSKVVCNYVFSLKVYDSNSSKVEINYTYDYRDKVVGNYKCILHYYSYGFAPFIDTTYIDTILITKINNNEINLLSTNIKLDSTWSYFGYADPHDSWGSTFYPSNDSLEIGFRDGMAGGGYISEYNGKKIN